MLELLEEENNKAHYFVGSEDDNLIFLDPHYVNEAIKKEEFKEFDVSSYIWETPLTLNMENLDPCIGFGFLVHSQEDFNDFKEEIMDQISQDSNFPIYIQESI